jgi:hypothetical protein
MRSRNDLRIVLDRTLHLRKTSKQATCTSPLLSCLVRIPRASVIACNRRSELSVTVSRNRRTSGCGGSNGLPGGGGFGAGGFMQGARPRALTSVASMSCLIEVCPDTQSDSAGVRQPSWMISRESSSRPLRSTLSPSVQTPRRWQSVGSSRRGYHSSSQLGARLLSVVCS